MMDDLYFQQFLESKAPEFFPEFDVEGICVNQIREDVRAYSDLLEFNVGDKKDQRVVIVKIFKDGEDLEEVQSASKAKKPRIYSRTPADSKSRLEADSLKMIYQHFHGKEGQRLGAVRFLAHLPEKQALVQEKVTAENLRSMLIHANRLRSAFAPSLSVDIFVLAGQWLREYHQIYAENQIQERLATKKELVEAIDLLSGYLSDTVSGSSNLKKLWAKIVPLANELLPEQFPLGLSHGDYAPRNVLVEPNGVLLAIDTFANWRAAIYEDIGYFINSMYTMSGQVASMGLVYPAKKLMVYEQAFLKGYFNDIHPHYQAVKFFEFLALLDKWASFTQRNLEAGNLQGKVRQLIGDPYFNRRAKIIYQEILSSGDGR